MKLKALLAGLVIGSASIASTAQAVNNVALLGIASQSSDYLGVLSGGPQKAIDGNTSGVYTGINTNSLQMTVTDTGNGVGNGFAWWQVALDKDYAVESITIWNRTDCCGDRLNSFNVSLWNDGSQVWTHDYLETHGPAPSTSFLVGAVGDTVRVQLNRQDYLHMAEVQVYGSAAAVPEPETYAMLLAGLGLMGSVARRRRYKQV